jgi:hypothetical protein
MTSTQLRLLALLLVGLGYFWLLVKIARPKPLAKLVKDSKGWLVTQTVLSWLCSFLFGFLTLWMLAAFVVTGGWMALLPVGLLAALGVVPFLFALSVRWTRIVMRKWKALRQPPAEAERN